MIALLEVKGLEVQLYLTSFHCPTTYSALRHGMPLAARAHKLGGALLLSLGLRCKVESHRTLLGVGEVAYWPPADSLVIAVERLVEMPSPVNPLGAVVRGLALLKKLGECEEVEALLRPSDREDV